MNYSIIILAVIVFTIVALVIHMADKANKKEKASAFAKEHFKISSLENSLRNRINEVLNADLSELSLNKRELEKREQQRAALAKNTREACLGDIGEREYVKAYLKELLQDTEGVTATTVNKIIPFDDDSKMTAQDKFEYMYVLFKREFPFNTFRHMCDEFGWDTPKYNKKGEPYYQITEEDISNAYEKCTYEGNFNDKLDMVTQRLYQQLYGDDIADIFIMDESIDGVEGGTGGQTRAEFNFLAELRKDENEEYIPRNYDVFYVVYKGRAIRMSFLSFGTAKTLERIVKNIYRYNTRVALSQRDPVIQSSLKNGTRIKVARPPVSDGWAFYARKFSSSNAKEIETLFNDPGSELLIKMLIALTQCEFSMFITGDPGSGKTTTLKSMVREINPQYAIRVVEQSFELNLNNLYPEKNVHSLQSRGNFSIYDAINATKQMDTDVIIIGEVNEPGIASGYVQINQSGSKQALTTTHHESTAKAIDYMRNALIAEAGITDAMVATQQVIDCVDFDIHMVCDTEGHYFVERITEVIPAEKMPYPETLEEATREYYARVTDAELYTTRNILEYDRATRTYNLKALPCEKKLERMREKLGPKEADEIIEAMVRALPETTEEAKKTPKKHSAKKKKEGE